MPRIGRSFPPQWVEPNLGGPERALGPEPPQILAGPAPAAGQNILNVNLAADLLRRRFATKRFPLQGHDESPVLTAPNFPALGIIDAFRYAGSGGLNGQGDWLSPLGGFSSGLRYGDNFPNTINPSAAACASYTGKTYGPDMEAYADIVQVGTTSPHYARLYIRTQNPASTTTRNGYQLAITPDNVWAISVVVANAVTAIASFTQPFSAGDKFGFRVIGTQLTAWWWNQADGQWHLVGAITDAQVAGTGSFAIGMQGAAGDTAWTLDNFGGGTVTAITSVLSMTRRRLGPFPPLVVGPVFIAPEIAEPTGTAMQAVAARVARQERAPHSDLFGFIPQVSAQPPPIQVTLASDLLRRRFYTRRFPLQARIPYGSISQHLGNDTLAGANPFAIALKNTSGFATPIIPQRSFVVTAISVVVKNSGGASAPVTLAVYSDTNGLPGTSLGSASIPASRIDNTSSYRQAPLATPISLTPGTRYWIVALTAETTSSYSVNFSNATDATVSSVPPGEYASSPNGGANWALGTSANNPSMIAYLSWDAPLTSRVLGPHPPLSLTEATFNGYFSPSQQVISVARARAARRRTTYSLFGVIPQVSAQPPPALAVYCLTPDRLARRYHRNPPVPGASLFPPTTLQVFSGPAVTLVHTRPRRVAARYVVPATLEPESVALVEREPRVVLVRTRPRHTLGTKLGPLIFYASTSEISVTLVRTRPRPTRHALTAVSYAQADYTILVQTVRARPRPTRKYVAPPATLQPYSVTVQEDTVRVALVRTRPRAKAGRLAPPTVLQTFAGPEVMLVRARPRRTGAVVAPPATLVAAAVAFNAAKTPLARTRPRRTVAVLAPPATLEPESVELAERTIRVVLVRTRPRPPHVVQRGLIFYPATSEITTALVRTRPRPTRRSLTAISYPQTGVGFRRTIRTRPRPTTRLLLPPATLQPYAVTVAEDTIRVSLTRTHPRHTVGTRLSYVVYPATSEITVALVRIRPRPTVRRLTAVTYPQASEITVQLARTRPRHTVGTSLGEPTTLQVFAGPDVTLVRARPRPTGRRLLPPTVSRVPSVEQREQTITTRLVRARPRPTSRFLREPLVKTFPPAVTTFLPARLVATRPRPTRKYIGQPTVVLPLPTLRMQTITVELARTRPRKTNHALTALSYKQTSAIKATRVRTRPRPTTRFLAPPAALQVFEAATPPLIRVRPRPTRHFLAPPSTLEPEAIFLVERQLRVMLVRSRPRRTLRRLAAPTVLQTFTGPRVTLVRARPRPTSRLLAAPHAQASAPVVTTLLPARLVTARAALTSRFLRPPAVVVPPPSLRAQTVQVTLARTRPRPTVQSLRPPVTRAATSTIQVSLVQARPRPTLHRVLPPAEGARPVAHLTGLIAGGLSTGWQAPSLASGWQPGQPVGGWTGGPVQVDLVPGPTDSGWQGGPLTQR